jgi:hypothetical protein
MNDILMKPLDRARLADALATVRSSTSLAA